MLPILNLYRALGEMTVGYSIGNAVFIEEGFWDQDKIYMHEHAHIYYAVSGNNAETKRIVAEARKNKPLVQDIEQKYYKEILYKLKRGNRKLKLKKGDVISIAEIENKGQNVTIEEFSKLNMTRLPDAEQDIINEELFVNYLQGPLSENFDMYFNPKNDYTRQTESRGWWGWFKKKNQNADDLVGKINPEKINITQNDFRCFRK